MPLFDVAGLSVAVVSDRARHVGGRESRLVRRDPGQWIAAVRNVSYSVDPGRVLAIVGESGSGKSLMLLGSLNMLGPGARVVGGTTTFRGRVVQHVGDAAWFEGERRVFPELDHVDWREAVGMGIGVMTQDPISAWDPIQLIGDQSGEVLDEHTELSDEEVRGRVLDLLGEVRLPRARKFLSFAEELSRGEAQRAMLAAALLSSPRLLLVDVPLSGLDVSTARALLSLIDDMRRIRGVAMVMVTHDLAVVAGIADRVAVVYGGTIVEEGPVADVYYSPRHPYTAGLLGSAPGLGARLAPIPGDAPDLAELPPGCPFAPRCGFAVDACRAAVPAPRPLGATTVRCIRANEIELRGVPRT